MRWPFGPNTIETMTHLRLFLHIRTYSNIVLDSYGGKLNTKKVDTIIKVLSTVPYIEMPMEVVWFCPDPIP